MKARVKTSGRPISSTWLIPLLPLTAVCIILAERHVDAHGFGSAITWNREISRIVFDKCASCHRPGGTAFSLMTYSDAQPRANAIKDAVLARRMPPWGAIKGFGQFRNDQSLTQEQIELVAKWVDGGIRRGNNPQLLPKTPTFGAASAQPPAAAAALRIEGSFVVPRDIRLDGFEAAGIQPAASVRITATLPSGAVQPLVWLHGYDSRYAHPFLLRRPISLPAGTRINGVPSGAALVLFPVR